MTPETLNPLKRLQQRRELLVILLFLFVIVVFWVGLSLLASQQQSGITASQQKAAQSLSPVLNMQVIEALENKRVYTASELRSFTIIQTPTTASTATVEETVGLDRVVLPEDLEGQIQLLEENL